MLHKADYCDQRVFPRGIASRGVSCRALKSITWSVLSLLFLLLLSVGCASHVLYTDTPESVGMDSSVLDGIDSIAQQEIDSEKLPGCVVLVAHKGTIVRHKAYGNRAVSPEKVINAVSTVYDLASLTKPVATTTAIALLHDDGTLDFNDKVIDYLPSFGAEEKDDVTIAHLLTHTSGLKPYLDMSLVVKKYGPGPNPDAVIEHICSLPRSYETGKSTVYSCLNFVLLARIAETVSGEPMHLFLRRRVWMPLGMEDTRFFLEDNQKERSAPTTPAGSADFVGKVHDPLARYYITPEHACGNAGLFSTAHDLAIFAQMLLNRGEYDGVRILKPETVDLIATVQTPPELPKKGFGWDIGSPSARHVRGDVIPPDESFGHTGFTGTSLWIDKKSETFLIILSNRTHMEKGAVAELRRGIANAVGRSIDVYSEKIAPDS